MRSKRYNLYVVINWKNDDVKIRKTQPGKDKIGPYDKVVRLNLELSIPEVDVHEVSEAIRLSQAEMERALSDVLEFDITEQEELER